MIIRFLQKTFFLSFLLLAVQLSAQDEPEIKTLIIGDVNNDVQKDVFLEGFVIDAANNSAIPGAVLKIVGTNTYDVTEVDGSYKLKMPVGQYNLDISFLGYEKYLVKLHIFGDGEQDFALKESSVTLNEVTISEKRQNDNITSVLPGVEQMTIEQIERQSKFLGETDVLRSLQSISGVSSAGEGASGFNVRGGNSDENLIFQDGNLIMNPVHALGFFSLFHPDMVNDVTLYKGGVPAKYGGRLSSVLDVKLREGDNQRYSVQGGIGIATSRLAFEGPIVKNKSSFIVGARASYFDWILKQTKNVDLNKSQAFFYDITAKADARITKSTKIGFSLFNSYDDFQFSDEVKFDYGTTTGSFYIKQLIGEKTNINAQINIGKYSTTLYDINGNDQSRFDNQINYVRGSLSSFFQLTKKYQLELGVEQNQYKVSPGTLEPLNEDSNINPDALEPEKGTETAFYMHNQIGIGKNLEIIVGLRYTFYQYLGPKQVFLYEEGMPKTEYTITDTLQYSDNQSIVDYSGFEPRLSLRWIINKANSIKLNYNRSFQFFSQISNTASATPIDVWQLSNYYIQPQDADNFSIGYYRNFRDNTIRTQVSVFYRIINNLIDYKDFAQLLLNNHIETELLTGIGKAYGLELTLNKDYGKHKFEMNYTYSRSLRKIEATATQESVSNGEWYPSNYDKPHIFNLNYFFQTSKKTNLSVNFTYSTGRPTTAPISIYSNGNILSIPIYSERNQFRIPDFHRLDIAYTIGPWGKKANRENSLTLSIYNVYFRKNAFSVFFRQQPSQSVAAYRVAVLGTAFPAITYNFKF